MAASCVYRILPPRMKLANLLFILAYPGHFLAPDTRIFSLIGVSPLIKMQPKRGKLLYATLVLAYVLALFYRTSLSAVKPDLEAAFGLSAAQYANLGSAFFYAYALIQIPAGLLVDTWGPRRAAALGMVLIGLSSAAFSGTGSYAGLVAARFVMGLGGGMIFPAVLKLQLSCFDESRFGAATGMTTFFGNLGGSLSQLPLVYLAERLTWNTSFLLLGGCSLLLGIGIWLFFGGETTPETGCQGRTQRIRAGEILQLLKNPYLYPPIAANFMAQGLFYCVFQWGIPYLTDVYGLGSEEAGAITAFLPVAAAVSTLLAGQISDRLHSRKRVGTVGALLLLAVMAVLTLADTVAAAAAAVILSGIAAYYSVYYGAAKDVCPPGSAGLATSLANMGTFAGASLIPLMFGYVLDNCAGDASSMYQNGFLLLLGLAAINCLISLLVYESQCRNCWNDLRLKKGRSEI